MLLRTTPAVLAALSNDDWTLVGLGMGVVFAGLIALILICYLLAAAFGGNTAASRLLVAGGVAGIVTEAAAKNGFNRSRCCGKDD